MDDGSTWPRSPNRLRRLWSRLTASSVPAAIEEPQAGAGPANQPLIASLVEAMPYPAIALDADLRVLAFNAAAREIVPAIRLREPILLVLRTPELVEAVRRADSTATPQRVEMIERVPPERWFEVFVNPVTLASGRLLLMSFNDRTPLRRVEEMRADFVANASHELRTPLAALCSALSRRCRVRRKRRCGRARALSRHHAAAGLADGAADRRSVVAVAHRAAMRICGPTRRSSLDAIVRQVIDGLQTIGAGPCCRGRWPMRRPSRSSCWATATN